MSRAQPSGGSGPSLFGKLLALVALGVCSYLAYLKFYPRSPADTSDGASTRQGVAEGGAERPAPGPKALEIGVAYGTEKKRWLEWAVGEFEKTEEGRRFSVKLLPMGSQEAAHAILRQDDAARKIHVWSPASALYKNIFVTDWQLKSGSSPILKEEPLALSPMVFVFWEERYQAFAAKYPTVSFDTISQALLEKGGWGTIAKRPEWGLFKFGHTHPMQSNSGLVTLVLMAYDFHGKSRVLELKDIVDVKFQSWMNDTERAVAGLSNSTGNMMLDMVRKGPSSYDGLFVYENIVLDHLKNAEGRWGKLRVIYPKLNMWNDNPYYIIDAPWSTAEHRKGAQTFLDFLLTEPIQRQALVHGFRPANPNVPVKFPESPFIVYQEHGFHIDVPTIVEAPRAEVMNNLMASWQRGQGSR